MKQDQPGAEKLVRDKIPQIIRETGAEPLVRVADEAEYVQLLRRKLLEEVGEFLDSGATEELADILEVVLALASQHGVDAVSYTHLTLPTIYSV